MQTSFPAVWEQYIEKLSEYMASTGKRYQSHAATIRRWAGEDAKKTITPSRNRDYSIKEDETVCPRLPQKSGRSSTRQLLVRNWLMTNFPTILNRLTGMFSEDRVDFIASFDEYDLLIIDDLGVERSTEYAMEQMFFVIDSRYRSRRPMIITTNLKLSELKNPPDLAHARIYDRILERCAPILFDGKNFREENAGATRQAAKDIVNSKHD